MLYIGDVLPFHAEVRDTALALANAGTMTLTVTRPDGTPEPGSPFTVSPTSTGLYDKDITATQAGNYAGMWVATGANSGSDPDNFDVRAARPALLISLADAKAHLNETNTLQDEEILAFLETATETVENIVGPCMVRTFTDRIRNGDYQLALPRMPIITVTSVTSTRYPSTTWVTADLDVDTRAGIVSLLSGGPFTSGPWNVVYTAGRNPVPARYIQATKELLWHLWHTQRGSYADQTAPTLEEAALFESAPFGGGSAPAIPPSVMQLLNPMPGIA